MDGRRRNRWLAAGLLAVAGATGCHRNATHPNSPTPQLPGAEASSKPEASKYFGSKDGPVVGAPQMGAVTAAPKRKPGDPLKPETEIALADTEFEAAFAEGRPAGERDQLLDSARQRYQRALKAQPKNQAAALGLARLYTKAGDTERAVETYRLALKASPKDHGLAHKMAATQAKFGDFAGAAESCRYALSLDPENRTYQKTLGFNLAQLGRWDEAHASLARVMPEAEARYFLGRVLYDLDKPAEARSQMDLALQADPQYALARQFVTDLDAMPAAGAGDIQTVGHAEPAADGK